MRVVKPAVLKNLIHVYIPRFIVEDRVVLDAWKSYTGVHPAPGVIELDGLPETRMRLGDLWKVGYDDTRFFEADVRVPASFAGRRVYLCFDFGGESIVRINGKIVGAVSSRANSGWVGRNEILFSDPLRAGETLHIQLESAVDCGGFCDRAQAGETHMTYEMKTAELQLINEAAEGLYYDLSCAFEIYERCPDPVTARRIYNAVETAAHIPDYDAGKKRFYADAKKAREYLKKALAKIGYVVPGRVIMAGHSHLDVAWLWTVNEITRKCARTFSNNLALMDLYPDFRFTQSQAAVYFFIKRYYPELWPRIKEKVKNGQWEIVGNTWVEADTNIASGESLVRQLLYGREFFMKEFGVCSDIYWLPDCFGFTAALPQIIKRSGMKYFFTSKLNGNDTNEFPVSVFRWRAHSGDEVLAYMQKMSYNGEADALYITDVRLKNRQNDVVDATLGCYGYGDGGGGCTYNMVERVRRYRSMPGMPEVKLGTAAEFFAEVEKAKNDLPVWDGEMYYENHRGTFTSQAFVKENNRRGEILMRDIELLGVLGGGYDKREYEELWRVLLTNQFHDILPGTSIHEVFENTRKEYAAFSETAGNIKKQLLSALSREYAEENSVVVWNLTSHTAAGPVRVKVPAGFAGLADENGAPVPCTLRETDGGETLEFRAHDVPAVGCRRYRLLQTPTHAAGFVTADESLLENAFLQVRIAPNGQIAGIFDKENEREVLSGPGNRLTVSHDKPIHESAWNLEADYKLHTDVLEASSVEAVGADAVKGVVRVTYRFHDSVIVQDITLYSGARQLDFVTHVDWREREKVLKADFPVRVRARYSTFEVAHGVMERPTFANNPYETAMFECCAHKWADLSESDYGAAIMNNCKYGHAFADNDLCITLMRGPVCPDPTGDIGEQDFVYSFYPHPGDWSASDVTNLSRVLNDPLSAVFCAEGKGRPARSFFAVSDKNIVIDAVKAAQDGRGVIVRLNETQKKRGKATLTLPFTPQKAYTCDLMEKNEGEIAFSGNRIAFTCKPFEVLTFRFLF